MKLRRDALAIFRAALQAADPAQAVRRCWRQALFGLDLTDFDRVFLVAAGKAAVPMASAIEGLAREHMTGGIVVTKTGHASRKLRFCDIHEAAHPVPDESCVAASSRVIELLRQLNARDLLIVALSGGASALLTAPAGELTLQDKRKTTDLLLRAGANIQELNTVRKHLSALKGGQLAALAYPARVVSFILSDVIGDPLDVIASGPTAPDPSSFADAIAVLEKYELLDRVPPAVRGHLFAGEQETLKPGDPVFRSVRNVIAGSNRLALEAARHTARELGYKPLLLTSTFSGEARDIGAFHASMVREIANSGNPAPAPVCILCGGESTVTVRGDGKGGRAQELALAAAIGMRGLRKCVLLSAGTDGTDGPTDAAGAIVDGKTAREDASEFLARNDSYAYLNQAGALLKTGPTGTNVMDVVVLLAGKT